MPAQRGEDLRGHRYGEHGPGQPDRTRQGTQHGAGGQRVCQDGPDLGSGGEVAGQRPPAQVGHQCGDHDSDHGQGTERTLPAGPAGPPAPLGGRDARRAAPSPAGGRPGKTPGRFREGPAAGGVPAGWPRSRRQGPSPRSRCEGRPAGQMAAPRRRALECHGWPGWAGWRPVAGGRGGRISGGGAPSRSGGGAPGGPAQPASGRGPGAGGGGGKCCTTWTAGTAGGTDRTAKARAITQPMKLQPSRMLITAIAATPGMRRARATRVGSRYSRYQRHDGEAEGERRDGGGDHRHCLPPPGQARAAGCRPA